MLSTQFKTYDSPSFPISCYKIPTHLSSSKQISPAKHKNVLRGINIVFVAPTQTRLILEISRNMWHRILPRLKVKGISRVCSYAIYLGSCAAFNPIEVTFNQSPNYSSQDQESGCPKPPRCTAQNPARCAAQNPARSTAPNPHGGLPQTPKVSQTPAHGILPQTLQGALPQTLQAPLPQ